MENIKYLIEHPELNILFLLYDDTNDIFSFVNSGK